MITPWAIVFVTLVIGCIECQLFDVSSTISTWSEAACLHGLATPGEVTEGFKRHQQELQIEVKFYWVDGRVLEDCENCPGDISTNLKYVCRVRVEGDCDDCDDDMLPLKGWKTDCGKGDAVGDCIAVRPSNVEFVAMDCDNRIYSICRRHESEGNSDNSAIVIGLSVTVVLVVLAATIIIAILCYKRRKQQRQRPAQVPETEDADYTYINDAYIVGSIATKADLHQLDDEYSTLDDTVMQVNDGISINHPYLRVKDQNVLDQSDEYNKIGQNDTTIRHDHESKDYDRIESDHGTTADSVILEDQRAESNDADYNRLRHGGTGGRPKKDASNYDRSNGMPDTKVGTNDYFVLEDKQVDSVDHYNRLGREDNKGKRLSNYNHVDSVPDGKENLSDDYNRLGEGVGKAEKPLNYDHIASVHNERDSDNPSSEDNPDHYAVRDKKNTESDDYNRLGEVGNKGTQLSNYDHIASVLGRKDADQPSEKDEVNSVSDESNRLGEGDRKGLRPSNYDHIANVGKDADNPPVMGTPDYFVLENETNAVPDASTKLANVPTTNIVTAL